MISWYSLSIITLFCQGLKDVLYKVSVEKNYNTAWVNFFWTLTVIILSAVFLFLRPEAVSSFQSLLLISFFGGIAYAVSTISRIEALRHAAVSVVFSLTRLSSIVVVIFSLLYFKDTLSFNQSVGIFIGLIVAFLVTKQHDTEKHIDKKFYLGVILSFVALIFGAASSIIPKFAAVSLGTLSFMLCTYIFNNLFSLCLIKKMRNNKSVQSRKGAFKLGVAIGVLNFFGFYAFLKALAIGPLSVVYMVQSLSFLIAIIFSILIYKEKMTWRRFMGILLAIAAVILMRE